MGVVEGSISGFRDLHFRICRPIFGTGVDFPFNLTTLKFRGWGVGVVISRNFGVSGY